MRALLSRALFLPALVAGLLACGRPYEPATPKGFVKLDEDKYRTDLHEYRASTADGVVLGIRAYENDPVVDLELAVRALENRLRFGQGYALLEKKAIEARGPEDGRKGMMLRFGHDEPSGSHLYYVTVFVTHDWVYVVEAGGKKELVEKAEESIVWATKNLVID